MAGPASRRPERNWLETSPRTATSPPAREPPCDLDRQVTGRADVVHRGAEGAHRVEHVAHRALAHAVRRVDAAEPLPEAGDGEQEAAGGAREPGVDERHVGDGVARRALDDDASRPPSPPSISAPSARSPSTIASVSSACSALVRMLVPSARAAHTRARLVMLFDPGARRRRRAAPSRASMRQRVGPGHRYSSGVTEGR